jgi:hypothetical protein
MVAACPLHLQPHPNFDAAANRRGVPQPDSCTAANCILFDHLIGARQQRWRYFEPNRSRGLEVDDQFILRRELHRQLRRLGALQDSIDIRRRLLEQTDRITSSYFPENGTTSCALYLDDSCGPCPKYENPSHGGPRSILRDEYRTKAYALDATSAPQAHWMKNEEPSRSTSQELKKERLAIFPTSQSDRPSFAL